MKSWIPTLWFDSAYFRLPQKVMSQDKVVSIYRNKQGDLWVGAFLIVALPRVNATARGLIAANKQHAVFTVLYGVLCDRVFVAVEPVCRRRPSVMSSARLEVLVVGVAVIMERVQVLQKDRYIRHDVCRAVDFLRSVRCVAGCGFCA